jgi:hypothetical protein
MLSQHTKSYLRAPPLTPVSTYPGLSTIPPSDAIHANHFGLRGKGPHRRTLCSSPAARRRTRHRSWPVTALGAWMPCTREISVERIIRRSILASNTPLLALAGVDTPRRLRPRRAYRRSLPPQRRATASAADPHQQADQGGRADVDGAREHEESSPFGTNSRDKVNLAPSTPKEKPSIWRAFLSSGGAIRPYRRPLCADRTGRAVALELARIPSQPNGIVVL